MKGKIFLFIIILLFSGFIAKFSFAQTEDVLPDNVDLKNIGIEVETKTTTTTSFSGERIENFLSEVTINKDGTITVAETIIYNFENLFRHGIFRTIPFVKVNQDGKKYQLDFKVNGVTDQNGNPYQYQLLKEGQNLKIKIGDPNKTITGIHTYIINYTVSGALTYFSDHDELYWNVTGNEWQVPIERVSVVVNLPQEAVGQIKTICFTGSFGSKEQNCTVQELSGTSVKITANQALFAREGLTFAVSFPKNIVAVLEPKEYGKKTLFETLINILKVIGAILWYFVAPVFLIFLWLKYGRDPKVGKPVSAWYDPPKDRTGRFLTPAEVGTLVDEKADARDLTATIISLAIRGYLKIKEEKKKTLIFENKDYTFIKKREWENDFSLQEHERIILKKFFVSRDKVSTSDLKYSFYRTFKEFCKNLYQKVVDLGFFPENPQSVRTKYTIFGAIALLTGNFALAILLFILGQAMPRKTLEGAKARIVALGLKNFLSSQERQLEFQVKNWYMFEKLLPYAIVFGVEKIWAERFKDLEVKPPDWYEGEYGRTFNTVYFTNSLSRSMTSMNSMTMSPTRSSSGFSSGFGGGGSSGGGGGGGGGGSW